MPGHAKLRLQPASNRPILERILLIGSVIVAVAVAGEASAQQYEELLQEALEAAAEEECPSSIMSPMLVDVCERQMPGMGQHIASLGPIEQVRYLGDQDSGGMGLAEVYAVHFRGGRMTWMINTGSDGKIQVLWSPG